MTTLASIGGWLRTRRRRAAVGWLLGAALACAAPAPASAQGPARESPQPGVVRVADLPVEARETLRLIERGGPFPYRKDGSVFGNRERRLPVKPYGYYREYTVPTPGARDRGARRIVTGDAVERFYTADHYRSFRRIVP
jgi:ribonuclease T1